MLSFLDTFLKSELTALSRMLASNDAVLHQTFVGSTATTADFAVFALLTVLQENVPLVLRCYPTLARFYDHCETWPWLAGCQRYLK